MVGFFVSYCVNRFEIFWNLALWIGNYMKHPCDSRTKLKGQTNAEQEKNRKWSGKHVYQEKGPVNSVSKTYLNRASNSIWSFVWSTKLQMSTFEKGLELKRRSLLKGKPNTQCSAIIRIRTNRPPTHPKNFARRSASGSKIEFPSLKSSKIWQMF